MTPLRLVILLTAACSALAPARPAEAACPLLTRCTCSVKNTAFNFGLYDPFSHAPHDGAGTLIINCNFLTFYDISLSPGGSSTYDERRMTGSGSSLAYNLYISPARNQVWGDGSGGTYMRGQTLIGAVLNDKDYTIYGRIRAGQNVPAGDYADTITVTVAY